MIRASGFIWPFVFALMFGIPTLMAARALPRRRHCELRTIAGIAGLYVFFLVFSPETDLSSPETLGMQEFLSIALFFSATLVCMMLLVLLCHRVSVLTACFTAVVGYTVENFGAGIAALADLLIYRSGSRPDIQGTLIDMALGCAVVYTAFYWFIVRNRLDRAPSAEPGGAALALFFAVILVNIIFDMGVKRLPGLGVSFGYCLLFRITEIVMCMALFTLEFELLFRRQMQIDMATTERLMRDWKAQYELSRDTIEAINIKMHDIRHQIRHLEGSGTGVGALDKGVLHDIAREVNLYDATVKTGNDALDTILTEKTLLGQKEHISLACIADGSALDFMSPTDLYSLFGNAIENAFDAVRSLKDEEQRNISLLVHRVADMASIHIENYYGGAVTFGDTGRPLTSKDDASSHGFGIRSMQLICERYGGTLTIDASGTTFAVNMLIPIPEA